MSDLATNPVPPGQVDVVIMAKEFARAKSRLSRLPAALRRELSAAMLHDTLDAVRATGASTVVVSGEPELGDLLAHWGLPEVVVVADPGRGLNAAVTAAEPLLGAPADGRLRIAVVADLPCLRPEEFTEITRAASRWPTSFVVDAEGSGTTMLAATTGPLDPHFGPQSARRHRGAGAVPLAGDWPGARHDVDTPSDVITASGLGCGPATSELFAAVAHIVDPAGDARRARIAPGPSADA